MRHFSENLKTVIIPADITYLKFKIGQQMEFYIVSKNLLKNCNSNFSVKR